MVYPWMSFKKKMVVESKYKVLLWHPNEFGFGFPTWHYNSDRANKHYLRDKDNSTYWMVVPCPQESTEERAQLLIQKSWIPLKRKLPIRTPKMFLVGGMNNYFILTPFLDQITLLQEMVRMRQTSYTHWLPVFGPNQM